MCRARPGPRAPGLALLCDSVFKVINKDFRPGMIDTSIIRKRHDT